MQTTMRTPPIARPEHHVTAPEEPVPRYHPVAPVIAVAVVLLVLVPYTVYFWLDPKAPLGVLLGFAPGLLSIAVLLAAGFGRAALYLRASRLSRRSALVLLGVFPLLAVILASGAWQGWDTGDALAAALSGVAQELYFRAALLPALLWCFRGRLALALTAQALLDVLWHGRMFTQAPLAAWPVIMLVLFVAKLGWGYAAHRDRTLAWVIVQHSAFLVTMSLFTWV